MLFKKEHTAGLLLQSIIEESLQIFTYLAGCNEEYLGKKVWDGEIK
jgi:hypothetical protein